MNQLKAHNLIIKTRIRNLPNNYNENQKGNQYETHEALEIHDFFKKKFCKGNKTGTKEKT